MSYNVNFLGAYDAGSLIEELKRISSVTGKSTVTVTDIDQVGRVKHRTVIRRFGSMRAANEAAGLIPRAIRCWSDEELLDVLIDLWSCTARDEGRPPKRADLRKHGKPVSPETIAARFGTWNKALLAARERQDRRWVPRPPRAPGERGSISVRTRFRVLKRDLYQCQICRKAGVALEVDHVIPVARGGSDEPDNLQTLCVRCNRGKRDSLQ